MKNISRRFITAVFLMFITSYLSATLYWGAGAYSHSYFFTAKYWGGTAKNYTSLSGLKSALNRMCDGSCDAIAFLSSGKPFKCAVVATCLSDPFKTASEAGYGQTIAEATSVAKSIMARQDACLTADKVQSFCYPS